MLKAIAQFLGGIGVWLGWRYSDKQVEKREQAEVDKRVQAAQDAAHGGNEAKVNEIINRTLAVVLIAGCLGAAGCVPRVVYVDDSTKVIRLEGSMYGLLSETHKRMEAIKPKDQTATNAQAGGLDAIRTALAAASVLEPNYPPGPMGWWVPDHVMADMLSQLERKDQ